MPYRNYSKTPYIQSLAAYAESQGVSPKEIIGDLVPVWTQMATRGVLGPVDEDSVRSRMGLDRGAKK